MSYPSDLKDKEWELVKKFFEPRRVFGRPVKYERRQVVNALFYITRTGCQWRLLPHDFPPWKTVYFHFHRWCVDGTWEKVLDALNQKHRLKKGRNASPTYAIVDSQSIKTQYGGEERGIDGGKKNQRSKASHRG